MPAISVGKTVFASWPSRRSACASAAAQSDIINIHDLRTASMRQGEHFDSDPAESGRKASQNITRAILSHDLQNHLQIVASALHIVERRMSLGDPNLQCAVRGATGSLV